MNPFQSLKDQNPNGLQLRLFEPPAPINPHPGDLSFEEWLDRPDVAHHGSFVKDWDQTTATHYGTKDAAVGRLLQSEDHLSGPNPRYGPIHSLEGRVEDWNAPEESRALGEGLLHSRRLQSIHGRRLSEGGDRPPSASPLEDIPENVLADPSRPIPFSDLAANTAHFLVDYKKSGSASSSVTDTIGPYYEAQWDHDMGMYDLDPDYLEDEVYEGDDESSIQSQRAYSILNSGGVIAYDNQAEGGVSYVVPRSGRDNATSWEEDVAQSNRSQAQKDAVAVHSRNFGARHAPIPLPIVDRYQTLGVQYPLSDDKAFDQTPKVPAVKRQEPTSIPEPPPSGFKPRIKK